MRTKWLTFLTMAITCSSLIAQETLTYPIEDRDAGERLVNSTFDRTMIVPYNKSGQVRAWTAETGSSEFGVWAGDCYRQDATGTPFSLAGTYRGANGTGYLCYDGHPGVDIKVSGATVIAATSGEVVAINNSCPDSGDKRCGGGYGNHVTVRSDTGLEWTVGHLAQGSIHRNGAELLMGHLVERGDRIAVSGNSGNSTGAHLHFDIQRIEGGIASWLDPYDFWGAPSNECVPDLVENGSFAKGLIGWSGTADSWIGCNLDFFHDFRPNCTDPDTGQRPPANTCYAATPAWWVDGTRLNDATGSIFQAVTIPPEATAALLGVWLQIGSDETSSSPVDTCSITIRNPADLTDIYETLGSYSNLDQGAFAVYTRRGWDVSQYIGQSFVVYLEGSTNNNGLVTVCRWDDVAVNISY